MSPQTKAKKGTAKEHPQQEGLLLKIKKQDLLAGLDKAMSEYKIKALTNKEGKKLYTEIRDSKDVDWDYLPTILSPKKFFFPQEEVILDYTSDGQVKANIKAEKQVLFGIRPCDLNSIKILDEAFAAGVGDPNYLSKREKSIVIGLDCLKLCSEDAFCYRVKSNYAEKGFDIFLTDLGEELAVNVVTAKGKEFVKKFLKAEKGDKAALAKFGKEKKKNFSKVPAFSKLAQFPEIFENSKDHIVWEEEGAKCLSCGSCILVCPTCYCFDVADELALNLKQGQRMRRWDACMLSPFAVVAGGENFREDAKNRLRHRINRKFNFLMKKHGQAVCVGCGRCVRACLADINPKKIAKVLSGEKV